MSTTRNFATEARNAADIARPTARRGRVADAIETYWNGNDQIEMEYSDTRECFAVYLRLTSDIARTVAFLKTVTDAGIVPTSTDGQRIAFSLTDAEAVEPMIRAAFPEC